MEQVNNSRKKPKYFWVKNKAKIINLTVDIINPFKYDIDKLSQKGLNEITVNEHWR